MTTIEVGVCCPLHRTPAWLIVWEVGGQVNIIKVIKRIFVFLCTSRYISRPFNFLRSLTKIILLLSVPVNNFIQLAFRHFNGKGSKNLESSHFQISGQKSTSRKVGSQTLVIDTEETADKASPTWTWLIRKTKNKTSTSQQSAVNSQQCNSI